MSSYCSLVIHSEGTLVHTNQTYLDISNYTQDAGDGYDIQVAAKGSELYSEDIKFSYSEDFITDIKCRWKPNKPMKDWHLTHHSQGQQWWLFCIIDISSSILLVLLWIRSGLFCFLCFRFFS